MGTKKDNEIKGEPINYGALPDLVGYQLRLAQIRVFRDFLQAMEPHEVSPGLFGVLMLIEANPGLTQSALAAAVHLDRSTMVGVIDRLEQRGWVERRAAADDRRAYRLMLTASGATQVRELDAVVRQHEQRILAGLNAEEVTQLHALLRKVAAPGK